MKLPRSIFHLAVSTALGAEGLLLLGSCEAFGPVGMQVARVIPHTQVPKYKGFAHQTIGVMCWADRGIRIDNPYLQLDVALGVEDKLKTTQAEDKPKLLEGATFPIAPRVIARYQEDHPEIEGLPVTDTAAKFTFTRLVYVEVTDFATRTEASLEMYRGSLTGNLQIVEIKNGVAKTVYQENDIHVSFPKDTPDEGLPVGTDYKIYVGTIDKFTTEIVHRLAPFDVDPDEPG